MIITKTPLRIGLLGGGSDYPDFFLKHGGLCLTATIDKYIYVTLTERRDTAVRVSYSQLELVDSAHNVEHELIRESMLLMGVTNGVEISTRADIPSSGSGLGSSGAVTVGTLKALRAYIHKPATCYTLAQDATTVELTNLSRPVGLQDQSAAAYGGLRAYEFFKGGITRARVVETAVLRELENNLLLFYTGKTREEGTAVHQSHIDYVASNADHFRYIKNVAEEGVKLLQNGNHDIGELLDISWAKKKQIKGVCDDDIDKMYGTAYEAGATGGKLCGAGGGGFLLLYCPLDKQGGLREAMTDYKELEFKFDSRGSRVVFDG